MVFPLTSLNGLTRRLETGPVFEVPRHLGVQDFVRFHLQDPVWRLLETSKSGDVVIYTVVSELFPDIVVLGGLA